MSDNVIAAIIGAVSALLVTLIKDVILDQIRGARESRKALIDRKLTELYSPLWVALGGGANTLTHILSDDLAYSKLTANFHLLSEPLKTKVEEFMKLGRGPDVRSPQMTSEEIRRSLDLHKEIIPILESEMRELRSQYEKY
jgi:hypothetical protein